MKSKLKMIFLSVALTLTIFAVKAHADEQPPIDELVEMEATAYCYGEITADGSRVREGICAAKRDWMGLTAIVYLQNEDGSVGEFLGYYEIKDTGGHEKIKAGKCIDIYMPSKADCIEFGRQKVIVKLVEGKG